MKYIFDFLKRYKIVFGVILAVLLIVAGIFSAKYVHKKETEINSIIEEAEKLSSGYFYDEAIKLIDNSGYNTENIINTKERIKSKKESLTEYKGKVYHVFFHSLIVYPSLAFDNDYKHEGYDMWMTTVSEFKAMLPQMYERGFILYSLTDIKEGEKIMLPEGKKPLIISIDDVNYYDYMEPDGFADKLVVDKDGNVLTEVKTPDENVEITNDGDVMPILDNFVKQHPDFSYRGAKGIVAVTGYEGAFGYNFIKAEGEEKEKLKNEANKVANALKNTGWLIACHSYTHNDYFKDGKVSNEDLEYDTNRFKERIYDVVLAPRIYISPFGYHLPKNDERLKYLNGMGYNYFCPVSNAMRTLYADNGVVISERFNLDRYNMRTKKEFINETFFNVDSVYYKELPLPIFNKSFIFTSGAGGWATELTVKEDLSFYGKYHDYEIGSTGQEYPNGSYYLCDFQGQFEDAEKINEYSYKIKLKEYTTFKQPETYEIIDNVKYIYSEPYGLCDTEEFIIYLPTAPLKNLPEEFLSWWPGRFNNEKGVTLGMYGIMNVNTKQGFFLE